MDEKINQPLVNNKHNFKLVGYVLLVGVLAYGAIFYISYLDKKINIFGDTASTSVNLSQKQMLTEKEIVEKNNFLTSKSLVAKKTLTQSEIEKKKQLLNNIKK